MTVITNVSAVLKSLDTKEWRPTSWVADSCKCGVPRARQYLNDLCADGSVEYAEMQLLSKSGVPYRARWWRKLAPGAVPQLQLSAALPGVSARPLADCWGGYTYLNKL